MRNSPPDPLPVTDDATGGAADAVPPPPLPAPTAGPSGPGTTRGAGRRTDAGRGRVFPCGKCGADVAFDIRSQSLKCPYCGHETALPQDAERKVEERDYEAVVRWLAEVRAGRSGAEDRTNVEGVSEVRCEGCGANVSFTGTLTSTDCAFCGMPIQRDKVHDAEDRVPVDGVLPFRVEQARAKALLAEWVRTRWFAPGEFKRRGADGRFAGVYVPYWTFDSLTFNRYSGERGEHYYVTVRVGKNTTTQRRTRWYPASGSFQLFFDDVMVVGAKDLPVELLQKLEPWPLKDLKPYTPDLLAGFLAETYSVEVDAAFREARERMEAGIRTETERQIGGDAQRIHALQSTYDAITYKHLLLPVWLLSYKYQGTTYRVVVNAVTGEVEGTRPWSAWKIAGLVLALAAAAAAIAVLANG